MAQATIHYFSGTGNTRRGVDAIAETLRGAGWEVELRGIERGAAPEAGGAAAPELTLVAFPVLSWSPPAFVKRYLRRLPRSEGGRAAAFATWGGGALGALDKAARMLERRGYEVRLAGGALYPSNWTQFENGPSDPEAAAGIAAGDEESRAFARALLAGESARLSCRRGDAAWSGLVGLLFGALGRRALGKLFVADAACTGCGLCERTCPAAAIAMREAGGGPRPRWSFGCENCNRCINACPARAIQSSGFRAAYHGALMILFALVALLAAGAGARAASAAYGDLAGVAAWLVAFAAAAALGLALQFGPLDRLAFRLEGARGGALRETGYTKSFRRYLAAGFQPSGERPARR